MRKYFYLLLSAVIISTAFTSCSSKSDAPSPEDAGKKLVEIKSSYQTYSYGELNTNKNDWERVVFDSEGRISRRTWNDTYNYEGLLGILVPRVLSYSYNDDGTIKTTSDRDYIYKHFYNSNKELIKKESWATEGIRDKEEFEYTNGKMSKRIQYSFVNTNDISYIENYYYKGDLFDYTDRQYSSDSKPSSTTKYSYDSNGNLIDRSYTNLSTGNVSVEFSASYVYDDKNRISVKIIKNGTLSDYYEVKYIYDEESNIMSETVRRRRNYTNEDFQNWMLITYEYIYK